MIELVGVARQSTNADTPSARVASADVYRVLAVFVVVIGHWLVST